MVGYAADINTNTESHVYSSRHLYQASSGDERTQNQNWPSQAQLQEIARQSLAPTETMQPTNDFTISQVDRERSGSPGVRSHSKQNLDSARAYADEPEQKLEAPAHHLQTQFIQHNILPEQIVEEVEGVNLS